MNNATQPQRVEPVPDGSELLALPFLSAIAGLLESGSSKPYRVTLHRAMTRGGQKYLQQVAPYAERSAAMTNGAGRIFEVDTRLVGRAFTRGKVYRTKRYDSLEALEAALAKDMQATGDRRPMSEVARSWLVVPFVITSHSPALVLFAESTEFNFFADDALVRCVVGMCRGFARMLDALQTKPLASVRNFPLGPGRNSIGSDGPYPTIHEELDTPAAPQLAKVESFNFEIVGP
jgi:hypothetical protein